jgi:hypothetical protein
MAPSKRIPTTHLILDLLLLDAGVGLDDPEMEQLAHQGQRSGLGRDLLVGAVLAPSDVCGGTTTQFSSDVHIQCAILTLSVPWSPYGVTLQLVFKFLAQKGFIGICFFR